MTLLLLLAGFALLVAGAEALVRGAVRLAGATGLSPLVIGLTVVAYGTSAPEFAASLGAALSGVPDLALGNVIGSNIANVLLILGATALFAPLVVSRQMVRLDVPIMLAVSLLVFALAFDGALGRSDGLLLVAGGIAYSVLLVWLGKRHPGDAVVADVEAAPARWWRDLGFVLGGLAMLILGARWLVEGAVAVAEAFGLSELVIGLTVVAIGTSLPELATSILAAMRGQRDLAVGNIVGSCIFNLLLVLGATAAIAPGGIPVGPGVLGFDLPVMSAVALACLPIFFTGHCIARWEGALFLGYYVAYTAYLLLDSAGHDALPMFSLAMIAFVVPLTVITLAIVTLRAWRHRHRKAGTAVVATPSRDDD
ncbi:MAG: calcium/sodium antiporter [Luteimonas sp.]